MREPRGGVSLLRRFILQGRILFFFDCDAGLILLFGLEPACGSRFAISERFGILVDPSLGVQIPNHGVLLSFSAGYPDVGPMFLKVHILSKT